MANGQVEIVQVEIVQVEMNQKPTGQLTFI
jgi:hypothetical protein